MSSSTMSSSASTQCGAVLDGNIWHLVIHQLYIEHEATEENYQRTKFEAGRVPAEFRNWLLSLRTLSRELCKVATPFAYWEFNLAGKRGLSTSTGNQQKMAKTIKSNICQYTRNLIVGFEYDQQTRDIIHSMIVRCQKLRSIAIHGGGQNPALNNPRIDMRYLDAFSKTHSRVYYEVGATGSCIGEPELLLKKDENNQPIGSFPAKYTLKDFCSAKTPSQSITSISTPPTNNAKIERAPLELLSIHGLPTMAFSRGYFDKYQFPAAVELQLDFDFQDLYQSSWKPNFLMWDFSHLKCLSMKADILPYWMATIHHQKFPQLTILRITHSRDLDWYDPPRPVDSEPDLIGQLGDWLLALDKLEHLEFDLRLRRYGKAKEIFFIVSLAGPRLKKLKLGGELGNVDIGICTSYIRNNCPNLEFLHLTLIDLKNEDFDRLASELSSMGRLKKLEMDLYFHFAGDKTKVDDRQNDVIALMDKLCAMKVGQQYNRAKLSSVMWHSTNSQPALARWGRLKIWCCLWEDKAVAKRALGRGDTQSWARSGWKSSSGKKPTAAESVGFESQDLKRKATEITGESVQ